MSSWKLKPRFNIDFSFSDMIYAFNNLNNDKFKDLVKIEISNLYEVNKNKIIITNSGRTALYLFLKALDLKKNASIGVQLFCCPIVFETILRAGYKPVFLEIDPTTFTLDINQLKMYKEKLDALIVVHTFGNPADMDSIKDIMMDTPIIEDCAHAVYSKYKNKFVGTFGDGAFFSYGPTKNISAGGGGALLINNNKKLKKSIETLLGSLDTPTMKENIKFVIINYLKSIVYRKPWYGLFAYEVAKKFDEQLDFQNNVSFKIKQITNPNIALIYKRYNSILNRVIIQQKNIESLKNKVMKLKVKTISPTPNSQPLFFLYPLVFSNPKTRDNTFNRLKYSGIDSLKFYSDTPEIARKKYGYNGECPITERIIESLLAVPTYYNIKNLII